jgi:catechol 2,3-dioxygenase-like lactoylglutathione lyase family enzyme
MIDGIQFGNVMIDCSDEVRLCSFYEHLLGWKRSTLFGRPALTSKSGLIFLFHEEDDYVPPVWPEEPGQQQKQIHFDFQVPDVTLAVAEAISLGARRAEDQFGDETEEFVTMFDPDGHPFCLCAGSNQG